MLNVLRDLLTLQFLLQSLSRLTKNTKDEMLACVIEATASDHFTVLHALSDIFGICFHRIWQSKFVWKNIVFSFVCLLWQADISG